MERPRPEVIVASTLYLMSSCLLDPTPCACRVRAILAHLETMMDLDEFDPVLRATAIQLHANWREVAERLAEPAASETTHETPSILH